MNDNGSKITDRWGTAKAPPERSRDGLSAARTTEPGIDRDTDMVYILPIASLRTMLVRAKT
jgi:hypothetical protein